MNVDFQLGRPAAGARIVVAMSGGVDSSVVAALAARSGAEVIGVTLQLYDHGAAVGRAKSCCAGRDIYDARSVAEKLGIAHYVFDYETRFRDSVIARFADEYARGRTPIPCVSCNQGVKFTDLLALARDLGADCLATGHYVRRRMGEGGPEIHRAADPARDQSYFLFATTREQLDFLRFPLGDLPKPAVREMARALALVVADKPDSQDICFVPNGSYAAVVERLRPEAGEPGDIVDRGGRVLGRHNGIAHFTVGQRKGLAIASTEPLYVLRLEPETRRVVVGPRRALAETRVALGEVNWLGPAAVSGKHVRVAVKLRSAQPPVPATLALDGAGGGELALDEPAGAVAPGQAAVFYDGERVLGGGWIRRPRRPAEAAAA
ncbi:MAG: tRNA 2-thiouridine(34) synthase MnmA [Alphaproteobacteria bacterium]|nr:tRNA 2-thiouridine(34) synthase MnmA [Alphaproteobacteria bacterium]